MKNVSIAILTIFAGTISCGEKINDTNNKKFTFIIVPSGNQQLRGKAVSSLRSEVVGKDSDSDSSDREETVDLDYPRLTPPTKNNKNTPPPLRRGSIPPFNKTDSPPNVVVRKLSYESNPNYNITTLDDDKAIPVAINAPSVWERFFPDCCGRK
jgi:hypothetical protein